MSLISGSSTFVLSDLSQPQLTGTGSFSLLRSELTSFHLDIAGQSFDLSDMTGCLCEVNPDGTLFVALEGQHGVFVWDFHQSIFAAFFNPPGLNINGTSEDNVSGILTSNTLHAVPAETGLLVFLFLLVAIRRITTWHSTGETSC